MGETLKEIFKIQKQYEFNYILNKRYVPRNIRPISIENTTIKVIIGPRRAGKSHFAVKLISDYLGKKPFCYVNFDSSPLNKISDFEEMIIALKEVYGETDYYLFDEIQNLEGWEEFVSLLQRRGAKIIITGSNSKLLSGELATKLTGRYVQIQVFPFEFSEYLKTQNIELSSAPSIEILRLFNSYLKIGGYPEVILTDIDKLLYLRDLFDAILMKDIRMRHGIRKPKLMEDFAYFLISNVGSEISFKKTSNILNCSVDSLIEYFEFFKSAFLFFDIPRYSDKVRQQIAYNKKIYVIDTGFIKAKGFSVMENEDILYENVVAVHLLRRAYFMGEEIYYWRSDEGYEVDFVRKAGPAIKCLIQVCYRFDLQAIPEREPRSLLIASVELNCSNLLILTESHETEITMQRNGVQKKIKIIPLYKWLLDN